MGLIVKLDVVNGQYTMLLSDVTGDYNATTNPEGWGTPNTTRASITAIECTILRPGQTVANTITGLYTSTFWTSAYRQVNVFSMLPTVPDGLYEVTVSFSYSGGVITKTFNFLRYESVKATLAQLAVSSSDKYEELKLIYDKMVYAEEMGYYSLAESLMNDFIDTNTGCGDTGFSRGCNC